MRAVWPYVRRRLPMVLGALFFLAVETLAELVQPTIMSLIVDEGVANADASLILTLGIQMTLIALLGMVGAVARNIFSQLVAQSMGRELRDDLFRKVQTLSSENIDRLQPGSLITRLTNDVSSVTTFVCSLMRIAVKMPVILVGSLVLIVYHTPQFLPILLVVFCILVATIVANLLLSRPRFARLQSSVDQLNASSREFLSSIRVIKAFGTERREDERLTQAATGYCDASIYARALPAVMTPLTIFAANAIVVALLWTIRPDDASQLGHLIASVNYAAQLVHSLGLVNLIVNAAARASVSAQRITEVLDEEPAQSWVSSDHADSPEEAESDQDQPALSFCDVMFSYAGSSREALFDVTFSVPVGATLGIVGPTGSGKSTLAQIVARFYDAQAGTVALGGRNITQVPEDSLREFVAIVPQASSLFSGTIEENLRWGKANATPEELDAATEIAQARAFVERLDGGYQARLGQGGVNLSGGQKQRLCIARALLRQPRLLVLDDCTSALDASTEQKVLDGLHSRLSQTTVLLISQRIATVRRADLILCLEDGRVQGFGTHDELLASCGTYQAIYESQVGALPAAEEATYA